ncbi:DUF6939 family protein [Thermomonospora cellulosilytica]|uniref:DUF6939 family protein n=1 Tax=Thermomonospora cellulosilytica TaxID=1411118 RepID=UPI001C728D21|nr:hypothetical protein [Thermomonospora cellulosilytica]
MPFVAIHVASRRRGTASIEREHPDALVVDVTSRAEEPWVRFSPFYPHGGIPVPFTPGVTAASVEGVWQALKVFADADVDPAKLSITTMRGLKRTVRRHGPVRGHRAGLHGRTLLPYEQARRQIYLPTYRWTLEHRTADLVTRLTALSRHRDVVLLDYTTNGDVTDLSTPLSHAALIRHHIENTWPA